jgi:hypothetical protein
LFIVGSSILPFFSPSVRRCLKIRPFQFDEIAKSAKTVIPDPGSGPGQARSGIQNYLKLLDARESFSSWPASAGMTKMEFF